MIFLPLFLSISRVTSLQHSLYDDLQFVYFKQSLLKSSEPDELVELVKGKLTEAEWEFQSVIFQNWEYRSIGLAHIEVKMVCNHEIDTHPETGEILKRTKRPPLVQHLRQMKYVLQDIPGVLSVVSNGGIVYGADVTKEERS